MDPEREASGAEASTSTSSATAGFVKRKNRGNLRKRTEEGDDAAAEDGSAVVRRAKSQKSDGQLAFTTKRATEHKAEPFKFAGSRTLQQSTDQGATATLATETDFTQDARALREAVLAQATEEGVEVSADGTYKGMNNYIDYRKGFRREHTIAAEKGTGMHGPLRANVHARVSVRYDYQPDLCKDYKETGFCGYGDSCKFVHDRGDYKSGWELDREWDQKQKARQQAAALGEVEEEEEKDSDEEDELPFACFICRRPWEECQDPVVTRCKHYFCEQCALKHNAKSGKCFVCETPTSGIFNVAQDVIKRTREKKKQAAG